MSDVPAAPDVARRLADALEAAGIPYALGGAIAYGMHAPPRATNDVDLNIFVSPDELGRAFDALESAGGKLDRAKAARSAKERGDFIVRVEGMRVDCFVPSIPLSDSAASRLRDGVLAGRRVAVLSAEDLVLFKLLFHRAKDVSDVERLVRFQGARLDRKYVRRWLVEMVGREDERVATWDRFVRAARPRRKRR